MTKLKTPLLGLEAHGTIADAITFQKRSGYEFAREKPIPIDRKTLLQVYHRWDYQDYAYLWHSLTPAEKLIYRKLGSKHHMGGFAYWMGIQLKTLPDLAARWHLDEKSGSLTNDSSRNSNTGTIVAATHTSGYIDYALLFAGVNQYVNVPNSASLNITDAITLEARVYPLSYPGDPSYVYGKEHSYFLCAGRAGDKWGCRFGGLSQTWYNSDTSIPLNKWYHFAITYDKDTGKVILYLNGSLDKQWLGITGTIVKTTNPLYLAWVYGAGATQIFHGTIDEVRIYNRALSAEEIKRHALRTYP